MTLKNRLASALFSEIIEDRVAEALKVYDDAFWTRIGSQTRTDLLDDDSPLKAYNENPLAFRLVHIIADHVLGEGLHWHLDHKATAKWLRSWWDHPANRMDIRCRDWLTELTMTGDLFVTFHQAADGMSIMRALPSSAIDEIETNPEDLEDERRYRQKPSAESVDGLWWPSVANGGNMAHFAINRPVGQVRGISDLQTVIPWLKRYSTWLKDRVSINKAKAAFVFDVTLTGSPEDIARRKAELMTPPQPGSVIIHNEAEAWKSVQSNVDAGEAEKDGHALRLMIAAGVGIPLHFLSEGESATRATAREMGEPTRRAFAERQRQFGALLQSVAQEAARRAGVDPSKIPAPRFPDLTKEDNFFLAQAASQIVQTLIAAKAEGWLTDDEARRWLRKFAGETPHGITTTE
ncbi:MAG: hypothetical protein V2A79_19895 [Planctomycetota bacterium]